MSRDDTIVLVFTTWPESTPVAEVARELLDAGVAACINCIPGVQSFFHWQGRLEQERECILLIKTTEARFPMLREQVLKAHPYELPEIVAVPVTAGLSGYLQWVRDSLNTDTAP